MKSLVDYGLHATITRKDDAVLDEPPDLIENSILSIKVFTAYEFGLSYGFIHRIFRRLSELDAVATVHNEYRLHFVA